MFKSITDNGYNGFYQVVEFCLEDSTEQSESNPGRSLGIITKEKRAVWKTVPFVVLLRLRLSPHALKRFTDKADATD